MLLLASLVPNNTRNMAGGCWGGGRHHSGLWFATRCRDQAVLRHVIATYFLVPADMGCSSKGALNGCCHWWCWWWWSSWLWSWWWWWWWWWQWRLWCGYGCDPHGRQFDLVIAALCTVNTEIGHHFVGIPSWYLNQPPWPTQLVIIHG